MIVARAWAFVAAVLVLALTGCQEARADPLGFTLDQPFVLGGGQEAVLTRHDVSLRFAEVLEDSRCPALVACFWTGQARITIVAESGDQSSTLEFNTNPAPTMTVMALPVGPYSVTLQSLDPYPQSADDRIGLGDYRATLVVRA